MVLPRMKPKTVLWSIYMSIHTHAPSQRSIHTNLPPHINNTNKRNKAVVGFGPWSTALEISGFGPTSLCLLPVIVTSIECVPCGRPGLSPVPSEECSHCIFNPGLPDSEPEVLELGMLSGRCSPRRGYHALKGKESLCPGEGSTRREFLEEPSSGILRASQYKRQGGRTKLASAHRAAPLFSQSWGPGG